MSRGLLFTTLLALLLVLPVAVTADDGGPPKWLAAHPDWDSDGPYWVAASYAIRSDGTVRSEETIGVRRSKVLTKALDWPHRRSASSETEPGKLGCAISVDEAERLRSRYRLGRPFAFPPGDFQGWVAASDAVVLGTVTGFVPGFDHKGRPTTLVLLEDTEHFYPSLKYPHLVEYVILPYARFVAGGKVFCEPRLTAQEYYPEVGDRLLIAADQPADKDGLALTVMSLSRVVQVKADGELVTYGRSDFNPAYRLTNIHPVVFAPNFPKTIDEARTRSWDVWRVGLVDYADTVGHAEFTKLWRKVVKDGSGCVVLGATRGPAGWKLHRSCSVRDDNQARASSSS